MKKFLLIFTILVIMVVDVGATIIPVYNMQSSKEAEIVVSVYNEGPTLKNVQASGYLPDLNIYGRSKSFKFSSENPIRIRYIVELNQDIEPDYYPVILYLENDDGFRKKTHSWVYIS